LSGGDAQGQLVGVALSFLRNFGIFSGASGVLGALSRGVASLGADQRSTEERAAARQQRNIGGVGEGLVEGGDALAQGFYRGFTGLVTKPLQGAKTGVGGAPLRCAALGAWLAC
jgi:vacuolar protein sorting-associated protein 13A/C